VTLPERLEGEGVVLRRWRVEDAETMQRVVAESADHLRPWLTWVDTEPPDVEGRRAFLAEAERAWQAVARLPDDRRRAVVLRFVNELPTSEIARILGRSEGAVRVLIHRALRAVADERGQERGSRLA